jgi:hypothetical protein
MHSSVEASNIWCVLLSDLPYFRTLSICLQIVGVDEMPRIERDRGPVKATDEDKKEFSALFDGESDSEDETR